MDDFNPVLRDLHTYQLRIQSVTEELEEGPRRLKRLQNKIAATEKALADHLAAIKALKVGIHDREVSVKANTDRMNKHKRDLDGISSKKEYDALNVEIASLKTRNVGLEDEAFAMMTQVEDMTAKVPAFEAAVTKAKDEAAKADAEHQAQLPAWQARLDEAKQIVQEKIKLLPEEWILRLPPTGRNAGRRHPRPIERPFLLVLLHRSDRATIHHDPKRPHQHLQKLRQDPLHRRIVAPSLNSDLHLAPVNDRGRPGETLSPVAIASAAQLGFTL